MAGKKAKTAKKPKQKSKPINPRRSGRPGGNPGLHRPVQFTDAMMIDALHNHKGMITAAAKELGCASFTIITRMKKSPEVKQAVYEYRRQFAEDTVKSLQTRVAEGEGWAVALSMKHFGPYVGLRSVDHSRIGGAKGAPPIKLQEVGITPEELAATLEPDQLAKLEELLQRKYAEKEGKEGGG